MRTSQQMGAETFGIAGRAVPLPAFFPSVSSVKANLPPSDYVRLLVALNEPQLLVSAYDVDVADDAERLAMTEAIGTAAVRGCSVLLDSGNYERFWRRDSSWTVERYAAVVGTFVGGLAFAYDQLNPVDDLQRAAAEIVSGVERDQSYALGITVCPIVHARDPDALHAIVEAVALRLQPVVLAVAERELGDGLTTRARTVRRLRATLDTVAPTTILHVLGTGNPIAVLAYSMAGAQTFDGLEWCQTCVDPDTGHLHHFQHRELVRGVEPSVIDSMPYVAGTLAHNLLFYRMWMQRIREAMATGTSRTLLETALPPVRRSDIIDVLEAL